MTDGAAPTDQPLRIGLVTPSANPAFETEVIGLLPHGMAAHTARLPEHADLDLRGRLKAYVDDLPKTVSGFGGLPLKRVFAGCTGSSYGLGGTGDARWADEVTAATGVPVTTAASAAESLLRALSRTQLILISPYPGWLTDMCVRYWEGQGFTISQVQRLPGDVPVYARSAAAVHKAVVDATKEHTGDDNRTAVVVTGTGASSLSALDAAVWQTGLPLLSSNTAVVWSAVTAAGLGSALVQSPSTALRRLHAFTQRGRA